MGRMQQACSITLATAYLEHDMEDPQIVPQQPVLLPLANDRPYENMYRMQ